MEKDREQLTRRIRTLERELEDLKDQNVQLQYKLEYTTEPMLMEQLQDVTDMRDALSSVKVQLEKEIGEKDAALAESNAALAAKQQELQQVREQYNHELHEVECERDELEQRATDAAKTAEAEAKATYSAQLDAKDAALSQLRADLEAVVQQKSQQIEELEADREVAAQQKQEDIARLHEELEAARQTSAAELEALRQQLSAKDSAFGQLRADLVSSHEAAQRELRSRIDELEKQASDSEAVIGSLRHDIEDFKADCAELWNTNEDLKQQIALTSAETMLRDAEMRETALSGQSALLEKVHELEYELQVLHEQLNEKSQEVLKLQEEARSAVPPVPPVDQYVLLLGVVVS